MVKFDIGITDCKFLVRFRQCMPDRVIQFFQIQVIRLNYLAIKFTKKDPALAAFAQTAVNQKLLLSNLNLLFKLQTEFIQKFN